QVFGGGAVPGSQGGGAAVDELEGGELVSAGEHALDDRIHPLGVGQRGGQELSHRGSFVDRVVGGEQQLGRVLLQPADGAGVGDGVPVGGREGGAAVGQRHGLPEHGVGDEQRLVGGVPEGQVAG